LISRLSLIITILGEGPPVLIVHGAGGGYDQGLWVARDSVGEGFRIIAPSRFGYAAKYTAENSS